MSPMSLTGATVAPAVRKTARHSSRSRAPIHTPIASSISSRWSRRASLVAKRGSSIMSALPMAANMRAASGCVDPDMASHLPSLVR